MVKCILRRGGHGVSSFISLIYSYLRDCINVYAFPLDVGISDARNISLKIIGARANISRLRSDTPYLLGTYVSAFVYDEMRAGTSC